MTDDTASGSIGMRRRIAQCFAHRPKSLQTVRVRGVNTSAASERHHRQKRTKILTACPAARPGNVTVLLYGVVDTTEKPAGHGTQVRVVVALAGVKLMSGLQRGVVGSHWMIWVSCGGSALGFGHRQVRRCCTCLEQVMAVKNRYGPPDAAVDDASRTTALPTSSGMSSLRTFEKLFVISVGL